MGMASKKSNSKTLSEKTVESFEPRPLKNLELDLEDETAAKFVQIDQDEDIECSLDNIQSDIRKRNLKPLSEYSDKYRGEISSRKEFDENYRITDDKSDNSSNQNDDLEEYRKRLKNYQIDSEPDEFLGTDESEEENDQTEVNIVHQDDSDYDSSGSDEIEYEHSNIKSKDETTELLKKKNQNADIQKGLSVQSQLKIWEKLLEVRIQSQKVLINANSLPLANAFTKFCEENGEFLKLAREAQQNVAELLEKMMNVQQLLLKQYPETKYLIKSAIKRKSSSNVEEQRPVKRFASELQQNFENFRSYRNSVLQKWHDRTKILTPGIGTKGHKSQLNAFDVVKKIEGILLNKDNLIKKSQIAKGNYIIFGRREQYQHQDKSDQIAENGQNNDDKNSGESILYPEIYDDIDFYHQQLRELIEFKTNNFTNPGKVSKQFAELQKLRHKMKKNVDTRASKGRKIRYLVHNKLVNFMAPNNDSSWTEESKDELYRSLFAT